MAYHANPQMRTQFQHVAPNSQKWTTGLCGCFDEGTSCVIGCCCPCILVGRSAEILDQGATSCVTGGAIYMLLQIVTGCGCLFSYVYRARLRQKFGLPENPCADLLVECCCHYCSICQVYRELQNRGFDPALGFAPGLAGNNMQAGGPVAPQMQHMTQL